MFRQISFIFLLVWAWSLEAQAVPRVLVSIKPIHSLVAAVMEGAGQPELLVTDTSTSPHSYALRPSDALKMEQAEIIFWVGESYETFLKSRLEALSHTVTVVKLSESPDLNLYPMRQGGFWGVEPHCACECQQHFGDEEDHDHDHGDAHQAYAVDGHLWLAPNNARAIVAHVAKTLADKDPINAPLYMANAEKMYGQLSDLAQELTEMLEPVKGIHYLLVHDFMQYFDRFFGTEAVGVIRIHPEIEPSMAHMVQVQKRLVEQRIAHCLFAEPQFDQKRLKKMAESAKVHFGILDYLGSDLEPGPSCYFEIMRRLGLNLVKSLNKPQISGVHEMLAEPRVILNPAQ
jgi:zinc transport system substrate-binding protein